MKTIVMKKYGIVTNLSCPKCGFFCRSLFTKSEYHFADKDKE